MSDEADSFLASLNAEFSGPSLQDELIRRNTQQATATTQQTQNDAHLHRMEREKKKSKSRSRVDASNENSCATLSDKSRWVCNVCTLENLPDVSNCTACDAPRNQTESAWACARCGYLNADPSAKRQCKNCKRKKRAAPLEVIPTNGSTSEEKGKAAPSLSPEEQQEGDGEEPKLPIRDPTTTTSPSAQPTSEFPCNDGPDELEDTLSLSDMSTNSEGSDDEEEDSSDEERERQQLSEEELKKFVEHLASVDPETLPVVQPPPVIQNKANLKPFQQQAYGWLMKRESEVDAVRAMPAASSAATSTRQQGESASASNSGTSGVNLTVSCRGGILADYMGLGKTRTMISLIEATRQAHRRIDHLTAAGVQSNATLIVCPVSLISYWIQEIHTVVGSTIRADGTRVKIFKFYGSNKKKSIFEIAKQFDYVLTSYQTLAKEFVENNHLKNKLNMIKWFRIVLDEAHYVRNPRSKQSRACGNLIAERRWALTATPLQNRLGDLFPILKFLDVPLFNKESWWKREIEFPILSCKDERALLTLKVLLSSIVLRRTADTKLHGEPILVLPLKTIATEDIPLSEEEQDFYDALHANAMLKLDVIVRRNTKLMNYATAFELLMRCRQACLHPYLVVAALQRKKRNAEAAGVGEEKGEGRPSLAAEDMMDVMKQFLADLKKTVKESEFSKKLLEDVENKSLTEKECPICFDQMERPAVLACAHVFCENCLRHSLQMNKRCPMCKQGVHDSDIKVMPKEMAPAPEPGQGPQWQEIDIENYDNWFSSSKLNALLRHLASVPEGEKVVVYSHFVGFLRYLERKLSDSCHTTLVFHGGLTLKQRQVALAKFNVRGSGPTVLLASIQCVGVGLTLTAATHCFLMDPSWNPGIEEQAINRIYRIGQDKPCFITRFLVANSVETQISALAASKQAFSDICLDYRSTHRLGQAEIYQLFARTTVTRSAATTAGEENTATSE